MEASVLARRWSGHAAGTASHHSAGPAPRPRAAPSFVIEPVTASQARIAREAYRDFGMGSGHPAGLNFGDCFAYALARELDEPLLFKGDDFGHTDIPYVGRPTERRRLHEVLATYDTAGGRPVDP